MNMSYGYIDESADEFKAAAAGGKFGLNTGFITKIELNLTAGKDGAAGNAIDLHVKIGEKEFRSRVFEITGSILNGSNSVSPGDAGYEQLFAKRTNENLAVIVHAAKTVGVTAEALKAALSAPTVNSFNTWAEALIACLPADYPSRLVDIFLQYEYTLKSNAERTYLQLPKNMKYGRFLAPAVAATGSWKEQRTDLGLEYIDDAGAVHPFTRSKNYLEGNFGTQQVRGAETVAALAPLAPAQAQTAANGGW